MAVRSDNRLDDAPMAPVSCGRCGAVVEVRKSSWSQTSVQWTRLAWERCEERCTAAQLAGRTDRGLFLSCSALSESIVEAVKAGTITVVDGSGQLA